MNANRNARIRFQMLPSAALAALALMLSNAPAQAFSLFSMFDKPAADAKPVTLAAKPVSQISPDLPNEILQAQALRKNGDFAGAAKILSQLVLFAPDDPHVLGEYGKTLDAEGRSDDALAFLERAIQLEPGEWSLYSAQGVAYDQKGNYQAALASYSTALRLKPSEPTVLNNAALSRMQAGDLAGAENLLRQAAPGTAEFPRIAQNLTLVQSLEAARDAKALTPSATLPPSATPALAVPAATMPNAVEAATAPSTVRASSLPFFAEAGHASTAIINAPLPPAAEPAAIAKAAVTPPAPGTPKTIADLQNDPTVRMAAIPKGDGPKNDGPKGDGAKPASQAKIPPATAAAAPRAAQVPAAKPARVNASSYYLQAGAYVSQLRAEQAAATLDSLGARVQPATVDGRAIYRVRIGPFLDMGQANAAVSHAQSLGHTDLKIVSE